MSMCYGGISTTARMDAIHSFVFMACFVFDLCIPKLIVCEPVLCLISVIPELNVCELVG